MKRSTTIHEIHPSRFTLPSSPLRAPRGDPSPLKDMLIFFSFLTFHFENFRIFAAPNNPIQTT